MKNDNRGLTLIELVVTVGIIAIFTGIVLSFITSSSNEFRSASSNTKVQRQTQETVDKIQEIVIDANRGVNYSVDGADVLNDMPKDEQVKSLTEGTKVFSVFNIITDKESGHEKGQTFSLQWTAREGKLDFASSTCDLIEESGELVKAKETAVSGESETLLSNIKEFCVDLSKLESEQVVRFRISVDEKGKIITTDHVINLRNKIKFMDIDSAFQADGNKGQGVIRIYTPVNGKPFQAGDSFIADWTQPDSSEADIVQSSIKWSIQTENPNLQVTLVQNDDLADITIIKGSGILTITVTANDANGNLAMDTIYVTVSDYELTSLTLTGRQLVGEGNSYTLEDNWTVSGIMSQGSDTRPATKEDLEGLVWLVDGNETTGSLNIDRNYENRNQVIIQARVGDLETDPLTVDIARVRIEKYTEEINAKNLKQIVQEAVYREGDTVYPLKTDMREVNGRKVNWKSVKDKTTIKNIDEEFKSEDKGEWTLVVEVQLDEGGSVSIVQDKKLFNVQILSEYRIVGPQYLAHKAQFPEGFKLVPEMWTWNEFWVRGKDYGGGGRNEIDCINLTEEWTVEQILSDGTSISSSNVENFDVHDKAVYVKLIATMKDTTKVKQEIPVLDLKILAPEADSKINKNEQKVICSTDIVPSGTSFSEEASYNWMLGDVSRQKTTREVTWNIENESAGRKMIKVEKQVEIPHTSGFIGSGEVILSDEINVELKEGESSIKITKAPTTIHIDNQSKGKTYPIDVQIIIDGQELGDKDYKENDVEWTLAWEDGSTINGANVIGAGKKIHISNVDSVMEQMQQSVRYAILTAKYGNLVSEPVKIAFTKGDTWVASPGETISFQTWDENYQNPNFVEIAVVDELNGEEKIIKPKGIGFNYDILKPTHQYYPVEGFIIILGSEEALKDITEIKYRYYLDTTSSTWSREFVIYINH